LTHHLGPIGTGFMGCLIGPFLLALGQGIVRNTQIFENVYMRQAPVEPAHQTKAYRDREDISKIVGWAFTVAGGVFLTAGLIGFGIAVSHAV
jgi:hypothetical protein